MHDIKFTKPVVLVLLVAVLSLGIVIYSRYYKSENNDITATTPTPPSSPPAIPQPIVKPLTSEERAVLKFPGSNASQQEINNHIQLVNKLVKETEIIDINSCSPEPLVFRTSLNKSFMIRNKDSGSHTIQRGSSILAKIPAGKTITVKSRDLFIKGAGNYGYSCDSTSAIVGIFLVVP